MLNDLVVKKGPCTVMVKQYNYNYGITVSGVTSSIIACGTIFARSASASLISFKINCSYGL